MQLLATLSPSFPHFKEFVEDERLFGIRFNPPMTSPLELQKELEILKDFPHLNVFYDVKGRQLRIEEVIPNPNYLEIRLNHAINVGLPASVLLKAGADMARLASISENGRRLLFDYNPRYQVKAGESLCIRRPYEILSPIFSNQELQKLEQITRFGCKKFFLSYVEEESDISSLYEIVGKDSEIWLKIENQKGLRFTNSFQKKENLKLVAARGDLYVEIDRPHLINDALKLIISKDSEACVGSRILLSLVESPRFKMNMTVESLQTALKDFNPKMTLGELWGHTSNPIPSCADFLELEYLKNIGYKNYLLCDELCLNPALLHCAVNIFNTWKRLK